MSFRREILLKTGGFRVGMGRIMTLPKGCEETELCIRASQLNHSGFFLYQPQAKVFHHVSKARIHWRYFFSRCFSEGLSKAQVSTFVGERKGLESEWSYTLKTLPAGFWKNLIDGFRLRQISNSLKALAIASGLMVTTGGYIKGVLFARKNQKLSHKELEPIESVHYEIDPNSSNNTEALHY